MTDFDFISYFHTSLIPELLLRLVLQPSQQIRELLLTSFECITVNQCESVSVLAVENPILIFSFLSPLLCCELFENRNYLGISSIYHIVS